MLSIVLNKKVKGVLEDLITPLGTFLMTSLQVVSRNWWDDIVLNCLTEGQLRNVQGRKITKISELDLAALIRVFDSNWNLISQRHEILPEFRNILKEMRSVRNRWSHTGASSYPKEDIYRDLDTINRFAKEIGGDASLLNNVKELMEELLTEISGPVESKVLYLNPKIKIETIEGQNSDVDILSVAAGKTKSLVDRYHVHSCPDDYSYKRTQYITFRAGGTGEMDALYEIDKVLIIPTDARDNLEILENHGLSNDEVQRLIDYIKENPFSENDRYYILSCAKELTHRLKPSEVNAKTIYYSLNQLLPEAHLVQGELGLFGETEGMDFLKPKVGDSRAKVIFFGLNAQKSSEEVGGWGNIHKMGLAVGVVWDSVDLEFFTYEEKDARQLVEKLRTADLVVGFNVIGFDYTVLQPYSDFDLQEINTFDMLIDVKKNLGFRLSLNHLAQHTLGAEKSADGLVSLQWYKEGKINKIIQYCRQDVEITRDLYLYGEHHGFVKYQSRSGNPLELKVDWKTIALIEAS